MEEKKTAKRIVSKGEYVKTHGQIVIMATVGAILYTVAVTLGLVTFALLVSSICLIFFCFPIACLTITIAGIVGIGTYVTSRLGHQIFQAVNRIDPGVPFTRSNTAHLPAQESLVRASTMPPDQPQAILLRPAMQIDTTPVAQLVRPAAMNDQTPVESQV